MGNKILLLKDKGSMLFDDLANQDHLNEKNQSQIIREIAKNIEEQIEIGCFDLPKHLISSYITSQMRNRKVSEGCLSLIRKVLPDEYKRDYNRNENVLVNDNQSVSIEGGIQRYEDITKGFLSDEKIAKLSSAEKQQYFMWVKEEGDRQKKVINDQINRNKEQAAKYGIPLENKQSAERPPEWFWGDSQFLEEIKRWKKSCYVLYKYVEDLEDLAYKFKPEGEIDKQAAEALHTFLDTVWADECRHAIYLKEKLLAQTVKIVDEKNRETMQKWLGIGVDKFVNFGSHAAGVLNSVDVGESHLKLKDGELYATELERPFTKEIVGDNCRGKLIQEAFDTLRGCQLENALNVWSHETQCEIKITDPTEYMQKKLNNPNIKVIEGDKI